MLNYRAAFQSVLQALNTSPENADISIYNRLCSFSLDAYEYFPKDGSLDLALSKSYCHRAPEVNVTDPVARFHVCALILPDSSRFPDVCSNVDWDA